MTRKFTRILAALALLVFMTPSLVGWGQTSDQYSYTFTAKVFDANNQTKSLGDVGWTLTGDGGYWGYDATKGQQFGSSGAPYKSMTLSTSSINGTISQIKVNTSGASSIAATMTVTVGGTSFGDQITLTTSANEYTFDGSASGVIAFNYTQTSSKAIYIKSITVTYSNGGVVTYNVNYNANGATSGDVPEDNTQYESGASVTVAGNTGELAKTHYGFGGWCMNATGTGTVYGPTPLVPTFNITSNTTLYAKWNPNTHTVTLPQADDYGTYTMDATNPVAYGTTVRLTYTPAEGYESYAATWSVNGSAIEGNSFTMPDEDVTISVSVAEVATFIFNTDEGLEALDIVKPASSAGTNLEENHDYVSGVVTMTITHGTTATRVWGGTSATDLRVYGGGGSLTFSVSSGQQITSVILVGEAPSNFDEIGSKAEHTATWSGTPNRTVTLTANNTCKINTITVVYEANASGVDTPVLPASSNFQTEKEITITGITEGATVYYTTDNTDPKTSNTRVEYTAPFTIYATTTVKAVAYLNSNYSNIAETTYTRVYNITVNQTNGGTISADKSQAAEGESISLTATPNVGYAFDLWTVTPSVTLNGNSFTMPASDVTVTATFAASTNSYTVSFSVNNKVDMTATVFDGGSIDLTKFVAEGDGYTFEGWSTTAGGENITPQNAYVPTADIILYPGVNPAPTGDEYTLVTSVDQLVAGNLVVIAASAYGEAMSTEQKSNNRGQWEIVKSNANISWTEGNQYTVCEFVLGGSSMGWSFYDEENKGYIYAAGTKTSGTNFLRTRASATSNGNETDNWGLWTVVIGNNSKATIKSVGNTNTPYLKYNTGGMFACYNTDSQSDVVLYTKPASKSFNGNRDGVPTTSKVTGIAANVIVTVKADGIVYLTGDNTGNEANLIVEDGGQLVASANVKGTMQKTINGYTSATTGWYFISSPLTTNVNVTDVENLINASGTGYDLYYFKQNPTINDDGVGFEWINQKNSAANFTKLFQGSGYLYANAAETTSLGFAGTLRKSSDDYEQSIAYVDTNPDESMRGWNLVGNPFPSNAKVNMAFYKMNSTSDGINPTAVDANSIIASTEGVFVRATEGESNQKVTFTATTDAVSGNSKGRSINIDVTRQGEFLDRAIVNINGEGSLSKLFLNNTTTKVYFRQDQKDYAIVASDNENVMPVNFKASRNDSYTFTVNTDDLDMNYLHLIDNMTGMDIDLLQTPSYTFEANTTDYESRFKLVFAGASASAAADETFAFFSNGSLIVSNEGEATLQVVDLTGRILSSESINGSCSTNINATAGVYMLRLINGDNVKVQKIVVR